MTPTGVTTRATEGDLLSLPENLEVLRRHKRSWLVAAVYEGGAVVRPEPFDAVDLDLASVWGATRTR